MEYKAYGLTDVGKARTNNEDAFFSTDREGIFLVSDGMGGHKAGEVASGLTKEIVSKRLLEHISDESIEETMREAIIEANNKVRETSQKDSEQEGMGCTCVVLTLKEQHFHLAHVGDSRIYLYRKGDLKQLTRDHSFVEELFIRGLIKEEEKAGHPFRNQITRYIGSSQKLEIDVTSGPVWNGDTFLLCTDGLTEMVSDVKIKEFLLRELPPKETVEELVNEALKNGGKDNVTVVVVRVTSKKTSFFKKILGW